MTAVTFVTPVAPYHAAAVSQAAASVKAQTVPCEHIIIQDEQARGAGWARNQGLARVTTQWVVFLDADDTIEPEYTTRVLSAFDGTRYVYTDWTMGDTVMAAPDCPFHNRTWHPITALVPTAWARAVGGFDETLPGAEDTAFYLALMYSGYCGRRLAAPLFHYGAGGQRARAFVASDAYARVQASFTDKYRGKPMGCCGDKTMPVVIEGDHADGDVLAETLWMGNRSQIGRATGRFYPRSGNGKQMWVDPRDIAAAPNLWRALPVSAVTPEAALNGAAGIADYLMSLSPPVTTYGRYDPSIAHPAEQAVTAPDFDRLIEQGKQLFPSGQIAGAYPIDAETLRMALPHLPKKGTALTVGAGRVGFYCVEFAKLGYRAYVVEPLVSEELRAALDDNPEVELIEAALAPKTGRAKFYVSKTDTNTSSLDPKWWGVYQHDIIEVDTLSVADLFQKLRGKVAVVQLDIEGGEADVLPAIAQREIPVIIFECGGGDIKRTRAGAWTPERMAKSSAAFEALRKAGYVAGAIIDPSKRRVTEFRMSDIPAYTALFHDEFGFGNVVLWR